MIKVLQRKFVVTAMTAISVLILILIGTINTLNIVIVNNQENEKLTMISENDGNPNNLPIPPDGKKAQMPYGKKNEYDTFISSNFFVVRFDNDGNAVYTDISRISSLSEVEATSLAQEVYRNSSETGKVKAFKYMIRNSRDGLGKTIVFLDTSGETYSNFIVLIISVGIGIACWGVMLALVALLSKKAIRPIAVNIDKQKQFVTNAGHEIKTPLAIIQSNTEAMELYNGENKWSKNIKSQIVRLNDLMKNLLTLSRMDEGYANLNVSEFSLSQLLIDSTQYFNEGLELREISLKTEIEPKVIFKANREHIMQLVSVLMDNAVKYTNDGGKIFVSLEKKDKRIEMQFRNTCSQLPSGSTDKLFDRFYRADESRTQKNGGYGIGLSVAQSIVEIYKGKITAECQKDNTIAFIICF